jgi:MFS transporter, NNP family, nitrate/nitrite transporter
MLLIAKDHPMGKWSNRHQTPAHDIQLARGHQVHLDSDAQQAIAQRDPEKRVSEKAARALAEPSRPQDVKEIDVAVNEALTWPVLWAVLTDMRTWMLSLGYATTFGYELALDANLANTLLALFKSPSFKQSDAGSLAATYGLLNLFCRFFGGFGSDRLYARYGIQAKKYWTLALAILQGIFSIGLGMNIKHGHITIGSFMGWLVLLAFSGFAANGGTYSTLPHISSRSNGLMCGIVGAAGSLGGIMYALIFRFQTGKGDAFWISGVLCVGLNALLAFVPLGDAA